MARELEARVVHDFAEDIAGKLKEATIIAQMASGLGAQDPPTRAFRTLLEGQQVQSTLPRYYAT